MPLSPPVPPVRCTSAPASSCAPSRASSARHWPPDAYGNGKGYPYVLVSPVQPEAGKTYQVAICGVSDQLAAETTVTDSGVVGMDAAKAFFGTYTTISRADTAWS